MWELPEERRLHHLLTNLLIEAASTQKLPERDVTALRLALAHERQQGKKLKIAFGYAIAVGIVTEMEAVELKSATDLPKRYRTPDPRNHVRRYSELLRD